MEVDSTSTSKDACEEACRVLAVKEATQETLTPTISERSVPVLGRGEDANDGTFSSTGLIEATARVAD